MQFGFALQQEQSQKLLMTTQMKQAIELLQCASVDLIGHLETFVADNPCVDLELPADLRHLLMQSKNSVVHRRTPVERTQGLPIENIVPSEPSLYEEVTSQLRMMAIPSPLLHVSQYIVGCLDESGFLREREQDIADALGVCVETVGEALHWVQMCHPKGIGARNLQECLLLQLDDVSEDLRGLVETIVRNHLTDVAAGKIAHIAKVLKHTPAEVQSAVDALKQLNPRPGLQYGYEQPAHVIPDVIVERVEGDYVVRTNDGAEPKLNIHRGYANWHQMDSEVRQYVLKKMQAAQWLVRCLEQRRMTLYKVAEVIVDVQRGFLDHGRAHLKPLTLRQVADIAGVHESTVSRATRGKYMATPRGTFEMKYFFTAELHGSAGSTSAAAAKFEIQRLVEREDETCPLSDDAIARTLQRQGIQISRRTVAKYREELNIAPSWRRRRFAN